MLFSLLFFFCISISLFYFISFFPLFPVFSFVIFFFVSLFFFFYFYFLSFPPFYCYPFSFFFIFFVNRTLILSFAILSMHFPLFFINRCCHFKSPF